MIQASFRLVRSLFRLRAFILSMAAKEMRGLHRGAIFGIGWFVLRPLIYVCAFVAILTQLFNVRTGDSGNLAYAGYILSGLVIWTALQQQLSEAPSLMRDRNEFLKQIAYPIETLPCVSLLANAAAPIVGLFVYVVFAIFAGTFSWTLIFLPIPLLLISVMLIGVSWLMMMVGLVFRDLREIVGLLLSIMIYASPVLLSEKMVPPDIWNLLLLNPLAHPIICVRDVLVGELHISSWIVLTALALFCFVFGALVLDRLRLRINEYL